MDQKFYDAVAAGPVIAAVKDWENLEDCIALENIKIIFLLFGDICNISSIVAKGKETGKIVMAHADLITGLSTSKEITVDYLKTNTQLDGIISTRPNLIRRAKELQMYTVLRLFVIDSMALEGIDKLEAVRPDFLEILPGVIFNTIQKISQTARTPLLAGGLISTKKDVMDALNAGAMAVSTTSREIWRM